MFTVETIWLSEQKRNRLTDCNRAKVAKDETGYRSFFYLPNNTESKYYYKPHAHIPTYSAAATRCFIFLSAAAIRSAEPTFLSSFWKPFFFSSSPLSLFFTFRWFSFYIAQEDEALLAGWPLCRDRMIRECLLRRDQIGIKWRQNAESAGPSLRFGSWCLSRDISQRPWSRKFTTGSDGSPSWSWRAVKSARRPAGCVSRKGHRPTTQQQQQQQPLLLLLQLMPVGGPAFTLERVKLAHLFGPASSINLLSRARANEWIYLKMKNKKNPGHLLPGKEVGPEMEWSTFFQQFWRKCAAAAAGRTRGLV